MGLKNRQQKLWYLWFLKRAAKTHKSLKPKNRLYKSSLFNWDMVKLNSHAYLQVSALGLLLVVLGGFLQYLLSLLVYKAPISKMAQSATLRREL